MSQTIRERLIEKVYATHKTQTRMETAAILDTILAELRESSDDVAEFGQDAADEAAAYAVSEFRVSRASAKACFAAMIDAVLTGKQLDSSRER